MAASQAHRPSQVAAAVEEDDQYVQVKHAEIHPRFLKSNATTHKWPFGAFAELADNAHDAEAHSLEIDVVTGLPGSESCLLLKDDGVGMNADELHKMMSLGHCDKEGRRGQVGRYGNGFKSGSMHLGDSVLVFSKKGEWHSVGMLSQKFLEDTHRDAVIVPIVTYEKKVEIVKGKDGREKPKHSFVRSDSGGCSASLEAITTFSPIQNEKSLLAFFKDNGYVAKKNETEKYATGTMVLIYDLARDEDSGEHILSFDEPKDIQIRVSAEDESSQGGRGGGSSSKKKDRHYRQEGHITALPMDYSLREYLAILYLTPSMKISLRGKKVNVKLIKKELTHAHDMTFKINPGAQDSQNAAQQGPPGRALGRTRGKQPQPQQKRIEMAVTMGFNAKDFTQYGMMLYHNNRLIKAYHRVGAQKQVNATGVGVIGVIEANHLTPTHSKQDFIEDNRYKRLMTVLNSNLKLYWDVMMAKEEGGHKEQIERELNKAVSQDQLDAVAAKFIEASLAPNLDDNKTEVESWIMCGLCSKWRKVSKKVVEEFGEDKDWTCDMNEDKMRGTCQYPEDDLKEFHQSEVFMEFYANREAEIKGKGKAHSKKKTAAAKAKTPAKPPASRRGTKRTLEETKKEVDEDADAEEEEEEEEEEEVEEEEEEEEEADELTEPSGKTPKTPVRKTRKTPAKSAAKSSSKPTADAEVDDGVIPPGQAKSAQIPLPLTTASGPTAGEGESGAGGSGLVTTTTTAAQRGQSSRTVHPPVPVSGPIDVPSGIVESDSQPRTPPHSAPAQESAQPQTQPDSDGTEETPAKRQRTGEDESADAKGANAMDVDADATGKGKDKEGGDETVGDAGMETVGEPALAHSVNPDAESLESLIKAYRDLALVVIRHHKSTRKFWGALSGEVKAILVGDDEVPPDVVDETFAALAAVFDS